MESPSLVDIVKAPLSNFITRLSRFVHAAQEKRYSRRQTVYDCDLSFSEATASFSDPNVLYAYMHHYLRYRCPELVRAHRRYFIQEDRGFGEDAFHAMWWLLLCEFKPTRMLEIGVYRGQVISLWALICERLLKQSYEVHGISPFSPLSDSVSTYLRDRDYMAEVMGTFRYWRLSQPILVKALSTDPEATAHIQSCSWDLMYIDGSHEYEVVLADYQLCKSHLRPGGLLVLDDASLGGPFHPPCFSFAGHPGPSQVARQFADREMQFLGAVGHNNAYLKM